MVLSIYEDSFFQKNSLTSSYYYARKITCNHPDHNSKRSMRIAQQSWTIEEDPLVIEMEEGPGWSKLARSRNVDRSSTAITSS